MTGHLLTFQNGTTATRRLPDAEVQQTRDYFISRGADVSRQHVERGTVEVVVGSGFDGVVILIVEP